MPGPDQCTPMRENVSVSAFSSVAEALDHLSSLFPRKSVSLFSFFLKAWMEIRKIPPVQPVPRSEPCGKGEREGGGALDTNGSVGHIVQ